jgi:hypothetical protein
MPAQIQISDYDEDYIEACFYSWYNAGRPRFQSPNGSHILKFLPSAKSGGKPSKSTIKLWMDNFGWEQRADALDAEVSRKLDTDAIEKRVATLRQLALDGKELKDKALDYIRTTPNPFADNPSAAVRALVAGSEMEFKYAGMADMLANVAQMTDKQIEREIYRLLGKNEDTNVVDAESEDIPSDNDDSTEDNEP